MQNAHAKQEKSVLKMVRNIALFSVTAFPLQMWALVKMDKFVESREGEFSKQQPRIETICKDGAGNIRVKNPVFSIKEENIPRCSE